MYNSRFAKKEIWRTLYETQEGVCLYCMKKMRKEISNDPDSATIDHIIPEVKGGSNHPRNYALCCRECNQSKGSEDLLRWWQSQPFYDQNRHELLSLYQLTLCLDILSLINQPQIAQIIVESEVAKKCLISLTKYLKQ